MDGNRDEALKCVKIAHNAMNTGHKEKALKFLKKSLHLFPTKEAQDLIKKISEGKSKHKNHSHSNGSAHLHGTQSSTKQSNSSEKKSTEKNYTSEQYDAVMRVKKSKDYYEILGIQKDASSVDIKKAYRKLALQLHPDKNEAPGATDAFKAVGKAFSILSDDEKREKYDLYGPEEQSRTTRTHHRSTYADDEFDPDQIFRMFFGGGYPTGNVRVFRRGNTFYSYRGNRRRDSNDNEEQVPQNNLTALIQFVPVIILLVVTLFSSLMVEESPYSLYANGGYQHVRTTYKLSVNYYVKQDFGKEYTGAALRRLESSVEDDYVDHLRSKCYSERVNKENLRRKGMYFSNSDYIKKADAYKTPNCERLEKLFGTQ